MWTFLSFANEVVIWGPIVHIYQQHNVSSISVTKIDVAFIDQSLVTSLVTKVTYYFREIIDSEFLWRFSSIA